MLDLMAERGSWNPPLTTRRGTARSAVRVPPTALAGRMPPAWIAPARSGGPGWRAFDDACPVMIFDAAGGGVQADPLGRERMMLRG